MQLTSQTVSARQDERLTEWQGPLFVVGAWRSGTSLLYALLNKHPDLGLMYEGDLPLLRALFWIPGLRSRWLARWEFWNLALSRHALDGASIAPDSTDFRSAMSAAYQQRAQKKGARIWGDKSPNYSASVVKLAEDFPHARFLIIWRDPTAICRSIVRAGEENSWFSRRGMIHRALMGTRELKSACERLVKRGVRVHQIHYEALVKDPARTMRGICDFLDVSFVRAVSSLEGADRSAIYNEGKHHSLVKGEKIVSSLERPEVLSPRLKRKIGRYVALWREETGGEWPPSSHPPEVNPGKFSFFERAYDRLFYQWLRMLDLTIAFIYCYAPLWLLKQLRGRRRSSE